MSGFESAARMADGDQGRIGGSGGDLANDGDGDAEVELVELVG